jgi:hypothetical protein
VRPSFMPTHHLLTTLSAREFTAPLMRSLSKSLFYGLALSVIFGGVTHVFAQEVKTTYVELSRTTQVVDGQQIIAIRVRPQIRPLPPAAAAPVPVPSPAEQAEATRRATKANEMIEVTATVYPGPIPVTELRWTACEREWIAYSNIDFRHFINLPAFETATTVYGFWQMLTEGDTASWVRPPGLTFTGGEAEYLVFASQADWSACPAAFSGLDALHSYYEEHRAELAAAYAKHLAEVARLEALPPPPPAPVIIRYYAPAPAASAAASTQP